MKSATQFIAGFLAVVLFVAAMTFAAIGCERSFYDAGPMATGKTVNNSPAASAMYNITKKACGDAIKDLLPTESLKKMATTYDAQGAPRQVEASAMPAPVVPPYETLYKTEGGDRQEFMVQDAPEGILTVVTALVDSEGNLYFFDDPADPISGSAKKQWLAAQAMHKAENAPNLGEDESLDNLVKAQAEWAKLKLGQHVIVVPPEVDSMTLEVKGVHTFQVVTAPKK